MERRLINCRLHTPQSRWCPNTCHLFVFRWFVKSISSHHRINSISWLIGQMFVRLSAVDSNRDAESITSVTCNALEQSSNFDWQPGAHRRHLQKNVITNYHRERCRSPLLCRVQSVVQRIRTERITEYVLLPIMGQWTAISRRAETIDHFDSFVISHSNQ